MYERTREFMSFDIAGFSHWYGAECLGELKAGTRLKLTAEPDNPYDPNAVMLSYKGTKLGYVPRAINYELSQLMFFGHGDVFKAVVTQVDPEAHPEHQVRVMVLVKDKRTK